LFKDKELGQGQKLYIITKETPVRDVFLWSEVVAGGLAVHRQDWSDEAWLTFSQSLFPKSSGEVVIAIIT
jgi:hypothetical protein